MATREKPQSALLVPDVPTDSDEAHEIFAARRTPSHPFNLTALRRATGLVGRAEVFDLDTEPARWHYYSGRGTVWHYGVRGVSYGIDPIALHMSRDVAEFLAAALNSVSGTGSEEG